MKVKKSIFWSVLSFLAGFAGITLAILVAVYAVWRTMGGYSLKDVVFFDLFGLEFHLSWNRFLFACGAAVAQIIASVIFKSIGKKVYRKRLKRAVEEARLANSSQGGMFSMDPKTQQQVAQAAKQLVPIVATVAVAYVVVGAVRRSQMRRRMEEMQMSRYYRY